MNRQSTLLHSLANQAVTRSKSTFAQRCAKFYTVRSARMRSKAGVDALGAQFKYNLSHFRNPPKSSSRFEQNHHSKWKCSLSSLKRTSLQMAAWK
jgi:hypothetical protein